EKMSNLNTSTFPDNNRETPTTPHIQVIPAKRLAEIEDDNGIKHQCKWSCKNKTNKISTTSIANYLRTKHRIIEGRFEGAEILPDSENKIENQDPLDQKFIELIMNDLLDWLIDNMQAFHLTPNLEIRQVLLTIENFKYSHLGNSIEDCLRKEFQKWNITSKLLGGTTNNDASMIKAISEDWIALEELILLLRPFVDTTNLTSSSTYPTLSLWFPTLHYLKEYLKNIIQTITSQSIVTVCNKILASLNKRWELSHMLGYIASFLDPRFKYLGFLLANQIEDTKQHLKHQIELLETSKLQSISLITSLSYNNFIFINFFNQNMILKQSNVSPIDTEISLYLQLPTLSVIPINHPEYHLNDPL
ncbi:6129_t:CDS:2, partial [Funneliformis geosporum]